MFSYGFALFQIVFHQITRIYALCLHHIHGILVPHIYSIVLELEKFLRNCRLMNDNERKKKWVSEWLQDRKAVRNAERAVLEAWHLIITRENYRENYYFDTDGTINRRMSNEKSNVSIISFIPFINYYPKLCRNMRRRSIRNQTLISFVDAVCVCGCTWD